MKNVTFTVEFLQHVLANNAGDNECKFQRTADGALIFQQPWWHSAFAAAIEGVDDLRHVKPSDIHMELLVHAPTETFKRYYGNGGRRWRFHEAIMPGTKVTFSALIPDRVSESNLELLLDRMGRFIGLSPFGHRLGFGRFRVLELNVQASEAQRSTHG